MAERLPSESRLRLALLVVALVVAVCAAYARVAGNGFVDYDDPAYVLENPHVRSGLTAGGVAWALTTGYHANWHPLTWLSHMVDVELYGLAPAGHHLVSLALHALNAVLLLLALRRLTGALWRSAAVAALFALHPLHVESVAWVAERKDVLSTLFWMLSLLAYALHRERPTLATRVALPVLLALGLMAKPMLVTLPFVLLLLDYWPLGRLDGPDAARRGRLPAAAGMVREKLPLFALAAVSSVVTWAVQARGGAVTGLDLLPWGARIANAAVAYVAYLVRALWPLALGALYPLPAEAPALEALLACAALVAITAAVLSARRRAPYLVTGWLWYLGTLVPVIGIVQVGVQSSADRYTYVPLVGVFVMLAWGLADLAARRSWGRVALAAATLLALSACAVLTWRQVGYWHDTETLFRRTLAVTSRNYVAESNLGGALARDGRLDEAILHFEEARRIRPDHAPTLSNLGVALQGKGRIGEAIALYREAVKASPTHVEAWFNLGNALEKTGDVDGAVVAFREADRVRPGDPVIGSRLAAAVEASRSRSGSRPRPEAAPDALRSFERGNELRASGRLGEAEAAYREAIRLDPAFAKAYNNLGSVLGRRGRSAEAILEIAKALEIAPDLEEAHNNLGIVLAVRGENERAMREFERALALDPSDATAHFNLGFLLARQGRAEDAIGHYEEALRLDPGYEDARRALAAARR